MSGCIDAHLGADASRGGDLAATDGTTSPDLALPLVGDLLDDEQPDLAGRDLATLDLGASDLASLDLTIDLRTPDLVTSDLAMPDLAMPDLAMPDLATPDLATPDLATPDLAAIDLATPDLATTMDLARSDLATADLAKPDLAMAAPDVLDDAALDVAPMAAGWTCQAFVFMDDVWVRTYQNGVGQFDFRIGAGGVLSELRDVSHNFAPLLSPSYAGEVTDRVVQWTWWSDGVVVAGAQNDPRYNFTQAGTGDNVLAPTISARVVSANGPCEVEVDSVPRDAWNPAVRAHVQHVIPARTRYRVFGEGSVLVRRTMRIEEAQLDGKPVALTPLYIEAWTPLLRPTFDALAVNFDGNGAPNWWYRAGFNIPQYGQLDVTTTPGFAAVFREAAPTTNVGLGLVFGASQPCAYSSGACIKTGTYVLNSMDWNNGIGVLPGMTFDMLPVGTVIDQHLVLHPARAVDAHFADVLRTIASAVPPPRVLVPGTRLPPTLDAVARALAANATRTGTRTDHLAPLLVP